MGRRYLATQPDAEVLADLVGVTEKAHHNTTLEIWPKCADEVFMGQSFHSKSDADESPV